MTDPMETGRFDEPTAEEQREYEARELDRLHEEMAAELQRNAEAYTTLLKVQRILREFALAPISISSVQPVINLAHELCPTLREELDGTVNDNPFA